MSESLLVKRVMQEIKDFQKNPSEMVHALPLENDLRTWHFTIRGPKGSEFEEGIYHGIIYLSNDYPIKPPNLYFKTPNGRFEINSKICLNITKFHPESWNPSWTIKTMLNAIQAYFPIQETFHGVGALAYTVEQRKELALKSQNYVCPECGAINKIMQVISKEQQELIKQEEINNNLEAQKNEEINNQQIIEEISEPIIIQNQYQKIEEIKQINKPNDVNRIFENNEDYKNYQQSQDQNNSQFSFENLLSEFLYYQQAKKSINFVKQEIIQQEIIKEKIIKENEQNNNNQKEKQKIPEQVIKEDKQNNNNEKEKQKIQEEIIKEDEYNNNNEKEEVKQNIVEQNNNNNEKENQKIQENENIKKIEGQKTVLNWIILIIALCLPLLINEILKLS